MHNLAENYKVISLIKPKSITATETGTAVAIEDYEDDALVVCDLGALGGTTETFIGKAQTSSDGGSNYTDAITFGTVTGSAGDNKLAAGKVSLAGKTHIKGIVTMDGTSASLVAMYLLVKPRVAGATVNSTTPA